MAKLFYYSIALAMLPFLHACTDDGVSGSSVASDSPIMQATDESPLYMQQALARAEQLSTRPQLLVAICDSDGRALGHTEDTLPDYMRQCVEDAGME